jgi:flavin-binding protein dodecin
MADSVYKVSEIIGTSSESISRAIDHAIHKASETLRHLGWFEVTEIRGKLTDGSIEHYQVTIKVGFRLEE